MQKEPYRPLKDFVFESTLHRAEKGELPKTKTAETALYPQKPPYDTWLKDGKISVVHYTDNDGSPREDNVQLYVDRGFTKRENADGSTTLTRKGKDGKPTIEVTIPPAPTHDKPPSLFEKMGDASVDMIIYAGHAGYGKRVEDALSKGVSGTGEGKLVMLLQCYGEGSIESVSRAFPDAHLLSTREASDDNYDLPLLDKMFDGFDKRSSYDTIAKANAKEFNSWVSTLEPARPGEDGMSEADINWYKEHDVETHYFFPNSRDVLLAKMDRDRDGVTDAGDTLFNVVYPKRVDASGGYDPLDAGAPVDGLEGTAVNASIGQLNLVARYAELPAGLLKDAPWHPEVFQSVGFYEAVSPNDPRAFKFVVDGTIKVGVSSNFAHTPKEALARMMAVEAAQFLGERAGLGDAGTSALALSFLERVLHQEGGPGYSSSPVESPEVQERLFRTRYGMDLSFKGLQEMSGNPDDFVAATYEAIKAKVEASPQLKALAQAQPKRATEALTVPDNLQVQGSLDKDALQRLADRLGVQGTVDPQAHQWGTWTSPGSRVAITMKDAQDKTFYVSLGIDSEGVVRAASRIAAS